jgi:transcriptional regulator with XRE-family HTH domain
MATIIYNYIPWRKLLKRLGLSERAAAERAGISRLTWRSVAKGNSSVSLISVQAAAQALGLQVQLLLTPQEIQEDCSSYAVGAHCLRDGANSWKIHYMNLIDEFRRTLDARLLLLPPPRALPQELKGMLAAIVLTLCQEAEIQAPFWACKRYDLPKPWFVSETESLKATALLESPLAFRRNQIFVTGNFMERA